MPTMHWFFLIAVSLAVGCAELTYQKVPTPSQYSTWSDADQRAADAMEGVRYYLPRPFVHLKVSTPVARRAAFVSFRFDPASKEYVVELPQDAPTWVKRAIPTRLSITQALAAALATPAPEEPVGGNTESAEQGSPDGEERPAAERPATELFARTGYVHERDPVTVLGDRFDVVYLPDFEEQYVIEANAGIGAADVETRLRNGWAAEVFGYKVDNSNLIPYVIDQVKRASDAAAGIATTWAPLAAGLPPMPANAADLKKVMEALGAARGGKPESAGQDAIADLLGQVILFKLIEVRVAQPGLYPILKPRETVQWLTRQPGVIGADADLRFETLLQASGLPWIRPDVAFIPCPPFTMVGFNATTDLYLVPAVDRLAIGLTASDPTPTPSATVPASPGDVKATRAANGPTVTVTWVDKSTDEVAFIVERRVGQGVWDTVHNFPSKTKGETGESLKWDDPKAPAGELAYRVTALNQIDGRSDSIESGPVPAAP